MAALSLTIFISIILALIFITLFIYEQKSDRLKSPEQDALLPFREEKTVGKESVQKPKKPHFK